MTKRRVVRLGAAFLALLASACATPPVNPPPTLAPDIERKVEQAVTHLMREQHVPGLAIGIIQHGQVVYTRGFGVANVSTGQPVTPDTVFQMGSDAKMFVGIAVMQLRAQGRIELDTPIAHYLPYLHLPDQRYRRITVRHILSHRSGLPFCVSDARCGEDDYAHPEFDEGALERHLHTLDEVYLEHPPGLVMQYSDLGVEMVGDAIARLSGQPFEDYIRQHIFEPLGMQHSSFLLSDIPAERRAAPHEVDPTPRVSPAYPYTRPHAASSHLFSNVSDMSRFALVQLDQGRSDKPHVASAADYITMWTPEISTAMPSPWEKQLGLGWFLGGSPGHRLVGHAGGDTGFGSEVILAPDDGAAVVVMINRDYPVEEIGYQVMRWLLEDSTPGPH